MAKITVVALRKGGVGKTTTAQHLGHALATMDRKVLLVDLDPQGSLTTLYYPDGVQSTLAELFDEDGNPAPEKLRTIILPTPHPNLFLAPADDRLASSDLRLSRNVQGSFAIDDILRSQTIPFEHVIIDTAPGRSALLTAALVAADEVVIPVQLSPMGFHGFGAIDGMIMEARAIQKRTADGLRLRLGAVVPTFFAENEHISNAFLEALRSMEHPDYEGQPLPLVDPVPETTFFEKASAPMEIVSANGTAIHAKTIFEMSNTVAGSPTERGQQAYYQLARMVASV